MNDETCIIFGGNGFIGSHFAQFFTAHYLNGKVILADIVSKRSFSSFDISKVQYVKQDVCQPIDNPDLHQSASLIVNLAAVHQSPGHEYHEYFETNVNGAKNICNLAREENINTIVFTSSIAPYGTWEDEKTENSLPLPTSAYGSSKLVAEEIHKRWQAEKPDVRKLIIVRPGVVFGQNENGNFTRLYRAMKAGKFFYPGRKDTKKAAIYVKDLVRLMVEMAEKEKSGVHLYNTVYTPIHSIQDICEIMAKVTGVKEPKFTVPASALKFAAGSINGLAKIIGKSFDGIHPDRVKKLMVSTNINGQKLLDHGYKMEFSLEEAIKDWYVDCNQEDLY
jgi:nucleoside-diphosphate-sugar epimerase